MAEIGRNINIAFERGYDDYFVYPLGSSSWAGQPYKAKHMQKAYRAGWYKARDERSELLNNEDQTLQG